MASESYNCPASLLPFEFENWNPKYYNPVCRDWFKDSEKAQDKGIISDPYLMAQGANLYGITPCMPILEQKGKQPRFFGALCIDMQLTDDAKFFNKEIETKRFIFKSDKEFEEAT